MPPPKHRMLMIMAWKSGNVTREPRERDMIDVTKHLLILVRGSYAVRGRSYWGWGTRWNCCRTARELKYRPAPLSFIILNHSTVQLTPEKRGIYVCSSKIYETCAASTFWNVLSGNSLPDPQTRLRVSRECKSKTHVGYQWCILNFH